MTEYEQLWTGYMKIALRATLESPKWSGALDESIVRHAANIADLCVQRQKEGAGGKEEAPKGRVNVTLDPQSR